MKKIFKEPQTRLLEMDVIITGIGSGVVGSSAPDGGPVLAPARGGASLVAKGGASAVGKQLGNRPKFE